MPADSRGNKKGGMIVGRRRREMVSELLSLPRDELLKTYGFALGLKAQDAKQN